MSAILLHPVVYPAPERGARGMPELLRRRSAAARDAVRASAREAGVNLERLEVDAEGAPIATAGWHWSATHDTQRVAGVVHRGPVGIDLERVRERRAELVAAVLSDAERELLGGLTWPSFARLWTAKEAVLKAAGVGLAELSDCRLAERPGFCTMVLRHRGAPCRVEQTFLDDHVLAVHAPGRDWTVIWPQPTAAGVSTDGTGGHGVRRQP